MSTTILFTGATGYIGGAILERLLDDRSLTITALVRNVDKAKKLNGLGVATIIGSLDDADMLTTAASDADVVYHNADSDHLGAIKAILKGLKQRHEKTGKLPIFIHTSGTATVSEQAGGMRGSDKLFPDDDPQWLQEVIPPTAMHRNVELEILAADAEGYLKSYIVLPSLIYGTLTGRLADLGISNKHSIAVPLLVKVGVARGQGGMAGEGRNTWPHVEIHEVADLYDIIFRGALAGVAPHGREGYYFAENGDVSFGEVARAYTKTLYNLGKSKTPEPTPFTDEEAQGDFGFLIAVLGSNCRARSVIAKKLGWKPVKTTEDMLNSVSETTEAVVKSL
ncbi:NAD(P)-binding protein [Vararia minispora EC-137]|uniref:NAD(P)-binding protein n=1 Tax=Vararia minispora EC-137 TaxID=1314806 RepID=A0ACB8QP18_9AGAM|nr:NAD(P)-binding protein [Vararia minispora EC-137]